MSRRFITDPGAKAGIVLAWGIVTALATFAVATLVTSTSAVIAASLSVLALVAFTSRTFRGQDEPDRERPWWQMTSRPTTSFAAGTLFGTSAVVAVSASAVPVLSIFVQGVVAVLYCLSGIVQADRQRSEPRADRRRGARDR